MKIAVIIVAIKESKKHATRLSAKFTNLGLRTFIVVNEKGKEGFAEGVNKGLKLAKKLRPDIYLVANPDLSSLKISKKLLVEGAKKFDLWGYAFRQGRKIYYGGEIDKNRLTAGLRTESGNEGFQLVDFVSGSLICFTKKTLTKVGLWNESSDPRPSTMASLLKAISWC